MHQRRPRTSSSSVSTSGGEANTSSGSARGSSTSAEVPPSAQLAQLGASVSDVTLADLTGSLRYGDQGPLVGALQDELLVLGYLQPFQRSMEGDQFGRATQAGVMAFQRDAGIVVDGIFGPQSKAALMGGLGSTGGSSAGQASDPALDGLVPGGGMAAGVSLTGVPSLRVGSRGDEVRALQTLLNQYGASLTVDGAFGPVTQAAVMAYQRERGLVVDGVVGPQTAGSLMSQGGGVGMGPEPAPPMGPGAAPPMGPQLDTASLTGRPALELGMEGALVKSLQLLLNEHGATLLVDGEFGPVTERAVRAYQVANGLYVDGIAGPQTIQSLQSGSGQHVSSTPAPQEQESARPVQGDPGWVDPGLGDADPKGILGDARINPTVKAMAVQIVRQLQAEGYYPYIQGGFRTFGQQDDLYAQGRTDPGDVVTFVRGGGSWHNYGLALDIVFWNRGHTGPSWAAENPWSRLGEIGKAAGFTRWMGDEGWDFAHFEHHPNWDNSCYNLASVYQSEGLQAVWDRVM